MYFLLKTTILEIKTLAVLTSNNFNVLSRACSKMKEEYLPPSFCSWPSPFPRFSSSLHQRSNWRIPRRPRLSLYSLPLSFAVQALLPMARKVAQLQGPLPVTDHPPPNSG